MSPTRLALTSLLAMTSLLSSSRAAEMFVYFGTYASDTSKGIHVSRFDPETGKLSAPELAAETRSPSFLAIAPNKKWLAAVNEAGTPDKPEGAVSTYEIDPQTGRLTARSQQPSKGAGPCHVTIGPASNVVIIANYGSGSTVSYPLQADGVLGTPAGFFQHAGRSTVRGRQDGPHAHSANLSPDGRTVYVCDLGCDKIFAYKVLADLGGLAAAEPPFTVLPSGAGPRHFAFHPDGRRAYVINELSSTVTVLDRDAATGALKPVFTTSTLPPDARSTKNSTAHIEVHPSGKWVYGSNRGHDSIARFSVDTTTGWLRFVDATPTGGKTPRNFGIDPTGRWLLAANQGTDNVVVFAIDAETGALKATGNEIPLGKPVCVKFHQP